MVIKLGINGFGRTGRVIFRAGFKQSDLQITAINDPAIDIAYICYLLKFDSTHGKFCGCVTHSQDEIVVDGNHVKIFHEKHPGNVPWQLAGVQYVIEASGMFTSIEKASGHLASEGVKRVIVTAPSVDIPMVILGVNHDKLPADHKVISCASSTLYCLAPIVKILDDCYGVAEGFVTSIHAMTPSLKPVDGLCLRGNHWRDHRSILQNIIPATTGACKALGRVLPRVKDKFTGLVFRVPIANVSVLDLTVRLNSNTELHDIHKNVEDAGKSAMKDVIKICRDEAVSSDFMGESHSCIFDANSSLQLKPNFYKLVCWYENEYSFAHRVLDTVSFLEENSNKSKPTMRDPIIKQKVQHPDSGKKEVVSSVLQRLKSKQNFQSLMSKNPISSLSHGDSRKKCDISKVWNDDKPLPRQNINSFFHKCPQNQEEIECIKAHERLKILKQEFTKMVNITENLLKKSYTGNVKLDEKLEYKTTSNYILQDGCGTSLETSDKFKKSSTLFDKSEQRSNTRTEGFVKSTVSKNEHPPKETQLQISSPRNKKCHMQNKLVILENVYINKLANNNVLTETKSKYAYSKILPDKIIKINNDTEECKGKILDKDFETKRCINNNSSKCKCKGDCTNPTEGIQERTVNGKTRIATSDSGFFSLFKNSTAEVTPNKQVAKNSNDEIKNLETINLHCTNTKNDTRKDVIKDHETVNDIKDIDNNPNPNVPTDTCNDKTQIQNITTHENADRSQGCVVEGNRTFERVLQESDCSTKRANQEFNSYTVSNNKFNKNKQDIYDKLESVSGSNSDDSFELNERKSQIINIADLATSLENLSRLDNICKIIEISDELSNELFSALDVSKENRDCNMKTGDITKKKWSFRDLCERIKLDDFCEKVFGKSSR